MHAGSGLLSAVDALLCKPLAMTTNGVMYVLDCGTDRGVVDVRGRPDATLVIGVKQAPLDQLLDLTPHCLARHIEPVRRLQQGDRAAPRFRRTVGLRKRVNPGGIGQHRMHGGFSKTQVDRDAVQVSLHTRAGRTDQIDQKRDRCIGLGPEVSGLEAIKHHVT